MSINKAIRILIVDDLKLVRTGIRYILQETEGVEIIGEASSGREAINMARTLKPDIVLLDFYMAGIGGLEATRKLVNIPGVKVLIVTMGTPNFIASRLLQAGAAGYVTKEASREEVLIAIRTIQQKQPYISSDVANNLAVSALTEQNKSPFQALSNRQLQIALMIIQGIGSHHIAKELYITPKTVNTYRYAIFDKLNVKNDVELIRLAKYHGLIESKKSLDEELERAS